MSDEMIFCEDCVWIRKDSVGIAYAKCGHDDSRHPGHMVARSDMPFCSLARRQYEPCGPDAHLFVKDEK
jgi:hypothetical protein